MLPPQLPQEQAPPFIKEKSDVESHTASSKSVSKSSDYRNTERGKHEKNSKGSTIPTEIMKRLHVRKTWRSWWETRLHCRKRARSTRSRMLSRKRCPDAGTSYSHFRGDGYCRRSLRRNFRSFPRLYHARWQRDGRSFWMPLGSLPQHPFSWDPWCLLFLTNITGSTSMIRTILFAVQPYNAEKMHTQMENSI